MPKPAMPPPSQRKSELPGAIMVLGAIAGVVMIVGTATFVLKLTSTPPQGLELGYPPTVELIDFTGQIFYGRDRSTGICFAARFRQAKYGFTQVPCEALERLK